MRARSSLVALALAYWAATASAQSAVRIEIESSWDGLGEPAAASLVITGKNGRFTDGARKVDPKAVEALLDAVNADPAYWLSPDECGVDSAWLEANYAPALKDVTHSSLKGLPKEQIELFRTQFTSTDHVNEALRRLLYDMWHTDDYPKLAISVHEGQSDYGITSTSQGPFMLPWVGTDKPRGIYSCSISRAVYALLPKRFTNRERLSLNDSFRWDLAEQIMDQIRPEWDRMNAERLVGPQIAPVEKRFHILESAVSNLASVDLDGGQAWNATLQSDDLPANLILAVSLPYRKHRLSGVNDFLARNRQYTDLILSVPWLHAYLRDRPKAHIELRFVIDCSLSQKATADIVRDLSQHGKQPLADRVGREAEGSAFFEVRNDSGDWARALVFPNKEVLLWHFQGKTVFTFNDSEFVPWDSYGWHGVGVLIGPDGGLEH